MTTDDVVVDAEEMVVPRVGYWMRIVASFVLFGFLVLAIPHVQDPPEKWAYGLAVLLAGASLPWGFGRRLEDLVEAREPVDATAEEIERESPAIGVPDDLSGLDDTKGPAEVGLDDLEGEFDVRTDGEDGHDD